MTTAKGMRHRFWVNEAKICLKAFQSKFQQVIGEQDSVLQISCGYLTEEIILPMLGRDKFHRFVAVDASQQQTEALQNKNGNERLTYDTLDIAGDVIRFLEKWGRFKFIFCFFAKQWYNDATKIATNIRKLLIPGGECLVAFVSSTPIYDFYRTAAEDKRYQTFMQDAEEYIPRTHVVLNPIPADLRLRTFSRDMESAGFHIYFSSEMKRQYRFQSFVDVRDFYLRNVEVFHERMREDIRMQKDFLDECIKHANNGDSLQVLKSKLKLPVHECHVIVAYVIATPPSMHLRERQSLPTAPSNVFGGKEPFHTSTY